MSRLGVALTALALLAAACSGGGDDARSITVYSGRSEELVAPVIEQFEDESGIDVEVRYGDSAELAATILEEGDRSPADVFFAQDPASLGSVARAALFSARPESVLERVPPQFSDGDGRWVGVSGRARTVVYDTTTVDAAGLPADEDAFVEAGWAGRTNGSFLAFVAAKILIDGEAATLAWLEGMAANDQPTFPKNSPIVAAVNDGVVDTGLVNHYYLLRLAAEDPDIVAENYFFPEPTAGSLVMPAGVGIMATSDESDAARGFVEFLLDRTAQEYFADETFEYPLIDGVDPYEGLPPLASLPLPSIELSDLALVLDLATDLVAEAGLL